MRYSAYIMQYRIAQNSGGENFGKFGKLNLIRQYLPHQNHRFFGYVVVYVNVTVALLKFYKTVKRNLIPDPDGHLSSQYTLWQYLRQIPRYSKR